MTPIFGRLNQFQPLFWKIFGNFGFTMPVNWNRYRDDDFRFVTSPSLSTIWHQFSVDWSNFYHFFGKFLKILDPLFVFTGTDTVTKISDSWPAGNCPQFATNFRWIEPILTTFLENFWKFWIHFSCLLEQISWRRFQIRN